LGRADGANTWSGAQPPDKRDLGRFVVEPRLRLLDHRRERIELLGQQLCKDTMMR
jgi:hypothetical protein